MLSLTPSSGSPVMLTVPSTVPATISLDVVASSPVPRLSAQSPSALLIGSPGAPCIQLEATEDDPFSHEMRTASISSEATTTATMDSRKQTSDVEIPLEGKEPKRRGRPRKEQTKSRRSHEEKDLPTPRRVDSDSNGEGEGKANDGKRSGLRNGHQKQTHGSDSEPAKSGTTRAHNPKVEHSCSSAMAGKAAIVKSIVRRVQPLLETVSEPAVVSASPTPTWAPTRSEATPLNATVCRIISRV